MTSIRIHERPYTSPLIKTPTYPTVTEHHRIVEMTWEQRCASQKLDALTEETWAEVFAMRDRIGTGELKISDPEAQRLAIWIVHAYTRQAIDAALRTISNST